MAQISTLGGIELYEKATFNSFVSRLLFRAYVVVFRRFRRLADIWSTFPFASFGSIEHDSHVTRVEDQRWIFQRFHDDLCFTHGG